jgi:hypothetical protein
MERKLDAPAIFGFGALAIALMIERGTRMLQPSL